ncbi:hypothetical protein EVAR_49651_1 [Eumeta japonica]|uniref:Uncharacterized protein n=1 Tax=Eumeta variegata TaxID=151549 RepID=A0A4C1Y820_EUMVA|nr:hypothetical protein EVAR_49651_1 [Eumeta japonica]
MRSSIEHPLNCIGDKISKECIARCSSYSERFRPETRNLVSIRWIMSQWPAARRLICKKSDKGSRKQQIAHYWVSLTNTYWTMRIRTPPARRRRGRRIGPARAHERAKGANALDRTIDVFIYRGNYYGVDQFPWDMVEY